MSENKTLTLLGAEARIGILNRGEPACRFIRSVKEYNNLYSCSLKNIAFYIGKEEDSLFVRNSDEAYLLDGNNGERLSGAGYYLDHDLLISELKRAECTAVWVGWGFVSHQLTADLKSVSTQSQLMITLFGVRLNATGTAR